MNRPADVLMAAHLAKLADAERRSAEYVEHNNHVQHVADAAARRAGNLCAASTALGQHTWRCADPAGHNGNHHATTTAGATIVWPQAHV